MTSTFKMFQRRMGTISLAVLPITLASHYIYTRRIYSASSLDETPQEFKTQYLEECRNSKLMNKVEPTWGYYSRKMDLPFSLITRSPDDQLNLLDHNQSETITNLTKFIAAVFRSPIYTLEKKLSGIPTDSEPQILNSLSQGQLRKGIAFGNLHLTGHTTNSAWFTYKHPEFDFLLYFSVETLRNTVGIGFIERKGDRFEDLGSRVYTPLMLEGGLRVLQAEAV
ncbi:hypothetical protein HDV05_000775 [Chytridiales sp. JEL 0842]|nr:hypothetical protein HDV05_000775 [Chytridiales sp. JEL 0842]